MSNQNDDYRTIQDEQEYRATHPQPQQGDAGHDSDVAHSGSRTPG